MPMTFASERATLLYVIPSVVRGFIHANSVSVPFCAIRRDPLPDAARARSVFTGGVGRERNHYPGRTTHSARRPQDDARLKRYPQYTPRTASGVARLLRGGAHSA